MGQYIQTIRIDIDYQRLHNEMMDILAVHHLMEHGHENQISLTTCPDTQGDWHCSIGRLADLPKPEDQYTVIQPSLQGSYFHKEVVEKFKGHYRWRLLRVGRRSMPYSIHKDGNENFLNFRLHIPTQTNPEAFLTFFKNKPVSGESCSIHFEHLECGTAYDVNTTDLHTAWNLGDTDRYHIVGVRYENRDNGRN